MQHRNSNKEAPASFGGYTARQEYEQTKNPLRSPLLRVTAFLLFVVLTVLAVFGVIALARGDFFQQTPHNENGASGSIRVPVQAPDEEAKKITEHLRTLAQSQLVIEVKQGSSAQKGSGFLISVDGYAVCSASLFSSSADSITGYFYDGSVAGATLVGMRSDLGIAVLSFSDPLDYLAVPAENATFLQRGETLYAVGSYQRNLFSGIIRSGLAASVSDPVFLSGKEDSSLSVICADLEFHSSLAGAPVISRNGFVVGFCTDAIPCPYPNMTTVIPLTTVYTVANEITAHR
jgi:S1-C subfamily serine protease